MMDARHHAEVRSFDDPDRTTTFLDGSVRVAVVLLGGAIAGHGVYLPGWRWSVHAGPMTGGASQRHVGYVVSGRLGVRADDGEEIEVAPGELFAAEPGHDAWVIGDQPCIALDWAAGSP